MAAVADDALPPMRSRPAGRARTALERLRRGRRVVVCGCQAGFYSIGRTVIRQRPVADTTLTYQRPGVGLTQSLQPAPWRDTLTAAGASRPSARIQRLAARRESTCQQISS